MTLEITTIPCLSDNYAFIAVCSETGMVAVIDAPEAAPIQRELRSRELTPNMILLTHHHSDHIDGLAGIKQDAAVVGAEADKHRLPPLDHAVKEGDVIEIGASELTVIDVSGHTVGHIAFYCEDSKAIFTGDSLMAMGCGRLFEGTADQMWESLSKLAALPSDTLIYSGHEYTASNAKFAKSVDPDNGLLDARIDDITARRTANIPTVPSLLADELTTNPFLRAISPDVKAFLGMQDVSDAAVFAEIRARKDRF